ncbi:hypothetical protein QQ020_19515 [Fulvivirgaceae bacterium BMA12]|uniref:Uncharacterized protein n=1 Tax=Agaribacillus aureus TaxID=3051825 RepID=A0ABT8LAL8_9BACT|nr:hypothetical protein [Fulvivirgaceae bacterium BMA12]
MGNGKKSRCAVKSGPLTGIDDLQAYYCTGEYLVFSLGVVTTLSLSFLTCWSCQVPHLNNILHTALRQLSLGATLEVVMTPFTAM